MACSTEHIFPEKSTRDLLCQYCWIKQVMPKKKRCHRELANYEIIFIDSKLSLINTMLLDGRLTKYLFLKAKQSEFIFATT